MRDGFGRQITYLRLSITDRCDFRCRYCMPEHGVPKLPREAILSVEECVAAVRAAAACGVTKVRITGGEPLVRRGVLDICTGIRAIPEIRELCLTTNGSRLAELAGPLRRAGVDRLNVSLDTLRPDRFAALTRGGRLQDVLDGIAAAEAAGFPLKLNAVLLGGVNDDEIPALAALTREKPWQVRFIELMPMGPCAAWPAARFVPAEAVLRACPELRPDGCGGVAERFRFPGAPGSVGLIRPLSHRFCGSCDRLRLTADGKLKPCLHSGAEIPVRGLRGAALEAAVAAAVAAKPAAHHLASGSEAGRDMNEIGG